MPIAEHTECVCARWGLRRATDQTNVTWPCAELIATADGLGVHLRFGPIEHTFPVPRSRITGLTLRRRPLGSGLVIHHAAADVPEVLIFWTFRPRRLARALDELGYELGERRA